MSLDGLNLEGIEERCKREEVIHSRTVLKLIELLKEQQKELDSWRKEFMGV
jgi:hypothetical protein